MFIRFSHFLMSLNVQVSEYFGSTIINLLKFIKKQLNLLLR